MSWYVVVVPPMRERAAVEAMSPVCRAFAPIEYVFRRASPHNKKKVAVPRPLFPRYVFVENPDWYAISRLEFPDSLQKVVTGWLGMDGRPSRLPAPEVMHLIAVAEQAPPTTISVGRGLKLGDRAIISEGPFAGHTVRVTRTDPKGASILIDILGSMREIEAPLEILEAA